MFAVSYYRGSISLSSENGSAPSFSLGNYSNISALSHHSFKLSMNICALSWFILCIPALIYVSASSGFMCYLIWFSRFLWVLEILKNFPCTLMVIIFFNLHHHFSLQSFHRHVLLLDSGGNLYCLWLFLCILPLCYSNYMLDFLIISHMSLTIFSNVPIYFYSPCVSLNSFYWPNSWFTVITILSS